jgi:hypothetical protein
VRGDVTSCCAVVQSLPMALSEDLRRMCCFQLPAIAMNVSVEAFDAWSV